MYELGFPSGIFVNLCSNLAGIFMVHALYKTPRSKWKVVLTWILIYGLGEAAVTGIRTLFPDWSYESVAMLVGFLGAVAYIYLFPDIPKIQSVFTYFMIETFMNLGVLFSRTVTVFIASYVATNQNMLFLGIYIIVLVVFELLFYCGFREYILRGLRELKKPMEILSIFSVVGYMVLFLLVDPWDAWKPLGIRDALQWAGVILIVCIGYVVAFRALYTLRDRAMTEMEKRSLVENLEMSEEYYDTLIKQVDQTRSVSHDMKHHIRALNGLCAEQDWEGIVKYVEGMGTTMPKSMPKKYCMIGAVNALLEYYAGVCEQENIEFRCQVYIPQKIKIQELHLCIILGNALQNALEAVRKVSEDTNRYISIKIASADGKLAIVIVNPCLTEPVADDSGGYQTTKKEPGHGLGLGNIREAADHYGGWCGARWFNGVFTLQVML
jgi:sensor histidine kinase YesM